MCFERLISFSLLLFYFFSRNRLVSSALKECNRPLGLQDGRILNSQLSSSSHFEHLIIGNGKTANLKAEFARLNNSLAWCSPARRNSYGTFIEIDLYQPVNISGIATQGFRGVNAYYVKKYKVTYSKDKITWKLLKKVWTGNSDAQTVVKNTFNTPISARYLRVYPVTYNMRVCMRMELYGCTNLTTGVDTELPVVPTPTVTVPRTTVHGQQSTASSSSQVSPAPSAVTTVSKGSGSVKTAIPTLCSGTTIAKNNAPNTVNKTKEPHYTTSAQAPWSVSSQQAVVAAQRDKVGGEAHFPDEKPARLSTALIVALSVASVFVFIVIMFVIVFHQRKQKRCNCPDKGDGIPLATAVIDENLCNQEFNDTYKYGMHTRKCNAADFNLLNRGAV